MPVGLRGDPEVSLQRIEGFVAVPAPPVVFEFLEIGKKRRSPLEVVDSFAGSKSFEVGRD